MLLYLHIPYCDSKCHYCSFNSYVDKFTTQHHYIRALYKQLQFELERFEVKPNSIETLFIGGGTPSTIAPSFYHDIFTLVAPYLQNDAEITTEANPNSATLEWLEGMKELGINRVSFGVQSFDSTKLKALNRAHTSKDAITAILNAHTIGIKHISLDLIYNYKGDTKELLLEDINQAFALPIDHISAYELTIEPNTRFEVTPEVRQENDELAFFVAEQIKKRGFEHYEISNFGTYQSRHNKGYWQLNDYIGAGAGAVGFKQNTRYYPSTDIDTYIANPLSITREHLSLDELLTEKIFLGLRSNIGIDKHLLNSAMQNKAQELLDKKLLFVENNRYYNSNFFLADEISLRIIDT